MNKFLLSVYCLTFLFYSFMFGQNFTVNTATYIGGSSTADEINACDVAPDGTIVIGGRLPGFNPGGVTPIDLLGGGNGVVVRLNSTGTTVLSITRIGDTIQDLEVGADGKIAITGNFGVGLLNADASAFIWYSDTIKKGHLYAHTRTFFGDFTSATINIKYRRALSRVSIGSDGTVACLQVPVYCWNLTPGKPMWYCYVYNSSGTLLKTLTGGGYYVKDTCGDTKFVVNAYAEDVAVDGVNHSVIVAGWNPDKEKGTPYVPIHIPFIYAYDYSGNIKWKDYQFAANDCYAVPAYADSRINEITVGPDGYLYAAGYIHGGDHLFARNPKNVSQAANVHTGYDAYSNAYSMGAGIDQAYFCKYDVTNGNILKGQALLVRKNTDGTGTPNQSLIKGIEIDADGRAYMVGYCQLYLKSRATQQIAGTSVGTVATTSPSPANGSEIFLAIINPDWTAREVWTVFSLNNAEGAAWGIGVANGVAALAGEVFTGTMITTSNAIQGTPNSLKDGYLVTWNALPTEQKEIKESVIEDDIRYEQDATSLAVYFDKSSNYQIDLFNSNGSNMYAAEISGSSHIINTALLSRGVYIIKITNGDKRYSRKIVL